MVRVMSEKSFKYDAFISYRHGGIDQFVAENLHKKMETFKLPKNIQNKTNGKTKINRVFRDQEELPLASNLGDPIRDALEASEWLIVICSPRLRESKWCQTEIETFIELRGIDRVLAVLVEGEPSESFPEQLLYRNEEVIDAKGERMVIKRAVEPLAADVRGVDNKEVLKAMNMEMLRLLAPMFGVAFDDLRQRHRERKLRRNMMIASIIAGVAVAFGAVSSTLAIQINSQKNEIAKQNDIITASNKEIQAQADEITKKNETLAKNQALMLANQSKEASSIGRRDEAIALAMSAITESEGVRMPYTPEAQTALTDAMYVYATGDRYLPTANMYTDSAIGEIFLNDSSTYAAAIDMYGKIYLYDIAGKALYDVIESDKVSIYFDDTVCFIDDDRLAIINADHTLGIYSISTKTITTPDFAKDRWFSSIYSKKWTNNLYCVVENEILFVDKNSCEVVKSIETADPFGGITISAIDSSENYIATKKYLIDNSILNVYSLEGDLVYTETTENTYIDVKIYKDKLYILCGDVVDLHTSYSIVKLVDLKKNKALWSTKVDQYGEALLPSVSEDSDVMVFFSYDFLVFINQKNGKIIKKIGLDSQAIKEFASEGTALFGAFLRDGSLITIDATNKDTLASGVFKAKTSDLKNILWGNGIIMTLGENTNEVIFYTQYKAPGVEDYNGEAKRPEVGEYSFKEASDIAYNYNKEKVALVKEVVEDKVNNVTFILCIDGKIDVYKFDDKQYIETLSEKSMSLVYYGMDKNGNYYVGDYNTGHIYDSNFKHIGTINSLKAVDAANNKVIMTNSKGDISIPIRSLDEILDMAKGL